MLVLQCQERGAALHCVQEAQRALVDRQRREVHSRLAREACWRTWVVQAVLQDPTRCIWSDDIRSPSLIRYKRERDSRLVRTVLLQETSSARDDDHATSY